MKKNRKVRFHPETGQAYRPDFRRYEAEKYAWITHHPKATAAEYQQAMRELAEKCGI